ncbi:MAG: zinc-dependent peptidase [Flavobacteriaceae bacterium]|nr:zinc-dependent peptidase [Flavobacteriaceae bacterium]
MKIKYRILNYLIKEKSKQECHAVLMDWNDYYQNLSEPNKKIFQIRTILFLKTTKFNSEKGFEISNKMKLIVSSAFVQITFGLNQDVLNEFNKIFIAPRPYKYKNGSNFYKGDVNAYTKTINLSWPSVEKGFKISNDGLNLSIHEFGHCLILENSKRSYLSRIFDEKELELWKDIAKTKIARVKNGRNRILRDYAGSNLIEFFSVSLEVFFEKPDEFWRIETELFNSMKRLLNQDPRNKTNPILKR